MSQSRLIELRYYDPKAEVRLTAYADTLVLDEGTKESTMTAIRFGGYPEMVNAMAAAIHGGAVIDATIKDESIRFQCIHKGYTKQLSHDGVYATATLMANDEAQEAINTEEQEDEDTPEQPRTCYIFCPAGDRDRLFEELDRKTAAPLIPEFRDQILDALIADGSLHQMKVYALKSSMEAWALSLKPEDKNIVEVLERGLKDGSIRIPGADSSKTDEFSQVGTVTQYLNTFGVTVADRIRNQFDPLFDPASEPLSDEVLAVNEYIRSAAGYPLYDAQLAVAESVRRKLRRGKVAIIRAECGSGKTKIGSTALGALYAKRKTFNVVMYPSHITKKWVREIGETLPDTYGMVVKSPAEFDRLYGIAYAVTGLPFFAERNIDRLHSEIDPELFVTLRFVDDKGAAHELTRSHKGSRTGIVYDGQELRQLDLTEMFGEKDVFLSIFNPLYFIEELGDEGKNLLQRYLPMIPQEKVLAELAEPIREKLPAETLLSPEGRVKQLRKDIRELESTVIYRSIPETEKGRRLLANLLRSCGCDLSGIPGFRTRYGEWTLAGPSGFLIPVRNKEGLIQGLKIRLDDEADPGRKYRWLSSRDMPNGTRSYSWIHVTGNTASKRAYLTEGPLKGDVASFLDNDALFVCIGGVNALHGLKETVLDLGVTELVEAMDMDQTTNNVIKPAGKERDAKGEYNEGHERKARQIGRQSLPKKEYSRAGNYAIL